MLRTFSLTLALIVFGTTEAGLAQSWPPPNFDPNLPRGIGRTTIFPILSASRPRQQKLGRHAFCALVRSVTQHANQACGCSVTFEESGERALALGADADTEGTCSCQAACLD